MSAVQPSQAARTVDPAGGERRRAQTARLNSVLRTVGVGRRALRHAHRGPDGRGRSGGLCRHQRRQLTLCKMNTLTQIMQQVTKCGKSIRTRHYLFFLHRTIVLKKLSTNVNRVNRLVGIVPAGERRKIIQHPYGNFYYGAHCGVNVSQLFHLLVCRQ